MRIFIFSFLYFLTIALVFVNCKSLYITSCILPKFVLTKLFAVCANLISYWSKRVHYFILWAFRLSWVRKCV